jgi:hypothetical protein
VAFTPEVLDLGVRAVFAFPMVAGSQSLGAINLYRASPGPLSDDQHADSLVVTGVATRTLLIMQADLPAGELSPGIEADSNLRLVVHQASGMVSVQMGISVADALARLRAYAVRHGLLIDQVATEVTERRLRFDLDSPDGTST